MMDTLIALRDSMGLVPGVASCKIGMEANITPADYPMVRIVPSTVSTGSINTRKCEMLVYFGQAIHEFTGGLESLYQALFDMESDLLAAARGLNMNMVYVETVLDEDRVSAYKLMAIRLVVQG